MKTETIFYDDNGGFAAKYDGTCVISPDGTIWRVAVDNNGILSTTGVA